MYIYVLGNIEKEKPHRNKQIKMPELIVKRKKEFTFGLIGVNIYLDDKKIGRLKSGEVKKWNISKGKHTLFAKGGLILKSQKITFDTNENDIIALKIRSFGNGYVKSFLQIQKLQLSQLEKSS